MGRLHLVVLLLQGRRRHERAAEVRVQEALRVNREFKFAKVAHERARNLLMTKTERSFVSDHHTAMSVGGMVAALTHAHGEAILSPPLRIVKSLGAKEIIIRTRAIVITRRQWIRPSR